MNLLVRDKTNTDHFLAYANEPRNGKSNIMVTGFQSARIYTDAAEAEEEKARWEGNGEPGEIQVEIVDIHDIPECPIFATAYPIDADHIPDEGKEVEVRYRDGSRRGVVLNFMRKELLQGTWKSNPLRARWRYLS